MAAADNERLANMDRLYDQYGKPFEATHWGQYIVISEQGETAIGATMAEATERSIVAFGRGNYLVKIGQRAIRIWRVNRLSVPVFPICRSG